MREREKKKRHTVIENVDNYHKTWFAAFLLLYVDVQNNTEIGYTISKIEIFANTKTS